jgi:hypothetical protein
MSNIRPPTENSEDRLWPENASSPRPRRLMRGLGILLLVLAGLLTWYLVIFYLGWQSGQTALEEKRANELVAQVDRQVSLAQENVDQGSYALALRRIEWILERAPDHTQALALRRQAEAGLAAILTPQTPERVNPTSTPVPLPSPTVTLAPIEDPDGELQRIDLLVAGETWEEALPALIAFQWQFPDKNRKETDRMLYEAYIGLGLELVQGEQVELGLSYLEQAEKLGDLPQSVTDYRIWAELYLQGIAFYNVNWGATAYYFRDLCLAAPFYQSSCDRLHESLIAFGDQYVSSLDWCPALSLYEEAAQHERTQSLTEKLSQAREGCSLATPTPADLSPDSVPITGTQPLSDTRFSRPIEATRTPLP